MFKDKRSIIVGIIIIFVAVIFLGNNFDIWNINVFFDGWWTLFIIIPAIINIFEGKDIITSLLILLFGIILLFACQELIMWSFIWKLIFPVVLIIIGLSLIFKSKVKNVNLPVKKNKSSKENPNFIGILGGCDEKINYDFNRGTCVAIFGGVDLDLTKAKIDQDVIIDAISIFGGIDIKVPEGVDVKASGTAVFGGTEDKVKHKTEGESKTIYINYTCIFGGIDIK